ncbi:MAG TPA: hypothetical protein H9846_05930 [Candidatus Gemmiger excrementipullorum]|uniref:Uncharacterized protein n=1 Tax=Candidatus Gemmiger excrementipullorum TaxID=2838610 RepID=A0A9D1Y0Y7_9FIRM|nr:hypothetical protein [Candidatus Gemmiger excrementipullorum]
MNKLLIFEKFSDSDKTRPAFLVKKPGGMLSGACLWVVGCLPYIVGRGLDPAANRPAPPLHGLRVVYFAL